MPVWYFSGRKRRYGFYPSTEVPVWHTIPLWALALWDDVSLSKWHPDWFCSPVCLTHAPWCTMHVTCAHTNKTENSSSVAFEALISLEKNTKKTKKQRTTWKLTRINALFWNEFESHHLEVWVLVEHDMCHGVIHVVVKEKLWTSRQRTNKVTLVLKQSAAI